jgi:hypothetical protein
MTVTWAKIRKKKMNIREFEDIGRQGPQQTLKSLSEQMSW